MRILTIATLKQRYAAAVQIQSNISACQLCDHMNVRIILINARTLPVVELPLSVKDRIFYTMDYILRMCQLIGRAFDIDADRLVNAEHLMPVNLLSLIVEHIIIMSDDSLKRSQNIHSTADSHIRLVEYVIIAGKEYGRP